MEMSLSFRVHAGRLSDGVAMVVADPASHFERNPVVELRELLREFGVLRSGGSERYIARILLLGREPSFPAVYREAAQPLRRKGYEIERTIAVAIAKSWHGRCSPMRDIFDHCPTASELLITLYERLLERLEPTPDPRPAALAKG